jgi:hypothetical protein
MSGYIFRERIHCEHHYYGLMKGIQMVCHEIWESSLQHTATKTHAPSRIMRCTTGILANPSRAPTFLLWIVNSHIVLWTVITTVLQIPESEE